MRKVNGKHMNAPEYQAATMLLQLDFSGCKTLIQQRTLAARVFAHHREAFDSSAVCDMGDMRPTPMMLSKTCEVTVIRLID
jgi:hypothetical protein